MGGEQFCFKIKLEATKYIFNTINSSSLYFNGLISTVEMNGISGSK